jgi:hypothetical protein
MKYFWLILFLGISACSSFTYGPQPETTLEEIHHENINPEPNMIWGGPLASPKPKGAYER